MIAAGLRYTGVHRSLTYDELWHLGLSTGRGSPIGTVLPDHVYLDPPKQTSLAAAPPFYRVWTHMDGVLHPPLYVVTLRLWRDAFGESDVAAKSYSMLWSLVALAFVFAMVRLATDRYAATFVTIAMAIAPTQAYFADAVRGYAMLAALGAIALWLMVRIEMLGSTRRRAMALAATTLLLLLTHYFAAGAVAAIVSYGFWRAVGHRLAFSLTLVGSAIVYAIVWLPFALRQVRDIGSGDAFLKVADFSATLELSTMLTVPFRLVVDSPAMIYLSAVLGAILIAAAVATCFTPRGRAAIPLTVWMICTIGSLTALDFARSTRHGLFIRYFAIATPAVFALVAVICRAVRPRLELVGASALLIIAIVFPAPPGQVVNDSPDRSMIARSIVRLSTPDEAILICGAGGVPDFGDSVFIHLSHEPGLLPRPVMKVESPLSAESLASLPRRAWLVVPVFDAQVLAKLFPGVKVLETDEVPMQALLIRVDLHPDSHP